MEPAIAPVAAGHSGMWLAPITTPKVMSSTLPGTMNEMPTKDSVKAMKAAMGKHQ